MDLPVTVSGSVSLEQSLYDQYQDVEMLDGRNQYKCSNCNKLVDAKKVMSIPKYAIIDNLMNKIEDFFRHT